MSSDPNATQASTQAEPSSNTTSFNDSNTINASSSTIAPPPQVKQEEVDQPSVDADPSAPQDGLSQPDPMNLDGANDMDTSGGANASNAAPGAPDGMGGPPPATELRIPTKKDASLREFLGKMDDYAPIVSRHSHFPRHLRCAGEPSAPLHYTESITDPCALCRFLMQSRTTTSPSPAFLPRPKPLLSSRAYSPLRRKNSSQTLLPIPISTRASAPPTRHQTTPWAASVVPPASAWQERRARPRVELLVARTVVRKARAPTWECKGPDMVVEDRAAARAARC